MKYGRYILLALAFGLSVGAAAAESIPTLESFLGHSFPDNTDVRKQYWNNLITAPKESVWAFSEKVLTSASAGQVKVKSVKRGSDFLVQFLNGGAQGRFLEYSRGSYAIQRDSKTGYILQAKIFLQDDPGCYIRLYPQGEATRADVVMYGALIKKGLYVPGLIYYVLAAPLKNIIDETKRSFDWATVFGVGGRGRAVTLAQDLKQGLTPASSPSAPGSQGPVFVQASMPPLMSITSSASQSVSPAAALGSRGLLDLVVKATGVEALSSGLSGKGIHSAELSVPGDSAALPVALGLSNDGDPLVPVLPYRNFPRYDQAKGLPLSAIKAALYLDALANPDAVYALVGDSTRILVAPGFDPAGSFSHAYFVDGRELGWDEVLDSVDKTFRVLRIGLSG